MLIIPEIQLQDGKVITRAAVEGDDIVHDIEPREAVRGFVADGAQMLQIVDIDAARSKSSNNEALIREIINEIDIPVQVAGGIRTLVQINDWFEAGAARVVLGTVAITDSPLVVEAASRHPGGIIVHLSTRGGYVMIDGWKTQTAFMPQDLIRDLQMTGIAVHDVQVAQVAGQQHPAIVLGRFDHQLGKAFYGIEWVLKVMCNDREKLVFGIIQLF